MIAYDWNKMPAEERRQRAAARQWAITDSLDRFLAGRTVPEALRQECRITSLGQEKRDTKVKVAAVYLLVDHLGHVIYVGHSRAWRGRAGSHDGGWIGRVVDHVRVIDLAGTGLDGPGLEAALIDILQPPYNRVGTRHGLNLPLVLHGVDHNYEGPYGTAEEAEAARLAWQSSHPPTFPPGERTAAA